MANRNFDQTLDSLVKKLTLVQGSVVIGATGAVGTTTGNGVSSIARVSAGKYTITLSDTYYRFVGLEYSFYEGGAGSPLVYTLSVFSDPQSATVGVPAGLLTIQCRDAAGAAVDPASGAVLYFSILLRNSSVKGKGE